MTTDEIASILKLRGCTIVEADGRFALVHPDGYEHKPRAHELLATSRAAAITEAWLWLHPDNNDRLGVTMIQSIVMKDFGLPLEALLDEGRPEPLATARRIAMALCRELTGSTFQNIGRAFDRDHGTVINARDSVRDQCHTDRAFAARVGSLRVACSVALIPTGKEL